MGGGGGRCGDDVQRLFHLYDAAAANGVAHEMLVAVIVAGGVEFEQALAQIIALEFGLQARRIGLKPHANAGEDACQFLHIALRIAGTHAHAVQFHDLARIVFVDAVRGVLVVVEILQHGRVMRGKAQQIAEAPQCAGAQPVLVIAHHGADLALAGGHVEVVEPEPGELFLHLRGRIKIAQDRAGLGLLAQVVHRLLPGLCAASFWAGSVICALARRWASIAITMLAIGSRLMRRLSIWACGGGGGQGGVCRKGRCILAADQRGRGAPCQPVGLLHAGGQLAVCTLGRPAGAACPTQGLRQEGTPEPLRR
jgi:hypothetical protein